MEDPKPPGDHEQQQGTDFHRAIYSEEDRTDYFESDGQGAPNGRVYRRRVSGGYVADGTMPADCTIPAKPPTAITTFDCPISPRFGVSFSNLPIVNIREEFEVYCAKVHDPEFRTSLFNMKATVELPTLIWRGIPHNVLTYMLQRAILGVEACVSVAADYELSARQALTGELRGYLQDPNRAPGKRGTAEMFYNNLPALVDPAYKLEVMNPALWESTKAFYKEVRNPLFHGNQLHAPAADQVAPLFDLLHELYTWLDAWWRAFPFRRLGNPYRSRGSAQE